MKKTWMLSIISATVILGACGNYDSSSEPLPYDNRVDEGENQAADAGDDNNDNGDEESDFGDLTDGVYETVGEGYNDDIVVETTIEGGEIVSVEILSHDETDGIGTDATDELPGTIVDANSLDVDGVSGATASSDGIKEAVRAALEEASGGGSEDLALTDGVFETSAEGYNDDIVVETTIEGGEIVGVEILSHDETDGIGTDATDELPGMIVDANSADVDGISGATASSDAIKEAVQKALEESAGGGDVTLTDGVFEASGEGYNDDIVVEVTVEDGEIANVEILSHDETDGIGTDATDELPGMIVDANSADVDGISGATYSSDGIKEAVQNALDASASAGGNGEAAGDLADGVYETAAEGYNDDVVVETTVEGGVIVSVEIVSHDETDGIGTDATDELPGMIVDANSADVDGVSGATYTSDAIKEAVQAAMDEAAE